MDPSIIDSQLEDHQCAKQIEGSHARVACDRRGRADL